MNKLVVLCAIGLAAAQSPPDAVFQSGTRLVEVDVVVRGKRPRPPGLGPWFKWVFDSGPPWGPPGDPLKGLTKDDFTLLDNGKPQPIAVFSAGPRGEGNPFSFPPGSISNRTGAQGKALTGATVVLVDFLNTGWIDSEYLRLGFKNLLRDLKPSDKVSVYTLGKQLHVLRELTGDELKSALKDYGDPPTEYADPREHPKITAAALKAITQHLSGVPGRKNLVWVGGHPSNALIAALQQADIIVYPVRVRSAGIIDTDMPSGGRMFLDAMDLTFAVRTAQEDSGTAYVLGYYPAEQMLDGKYHTIAVKLNDALLHNQAVEVHHRAGYLATRAAVLPPPPSLAEVFFDPLEIAGVGLAAQATREPRNAARYDVRVMVDLHDIHLERKAGGYRGGFDYAVPNPSSAGSFKTGGVAVDLTDQQLADALEHGLTLVVKGVEPESDKIRVVVRDRATGAAGSVQIRVPQE